MNLYAYCFNNPIKYKDTYGNFPGVILAAVGSIVLLAIVGYITYKVATSETNTFTFDTEEEAVEAWAALYRGKSEYEEKCAILYKITTKSGDVRYTYGRTFDGYRTNTIPGFIMGYTGGGISSLVSSKKEMIGFIHSHPKPKKGKHNDFPSDADLFLLKLPGISEVYIVPYSNCSHKGIPDIIKASDKSSWSH